MKKLHSQQLRDLALAVIDVEANAVSALAERIDSDFVNACELLLNCKGRIVVTGVGKSGHIGRKIAATLASTGTPAFFMHAGEASHGDLGMLTSQDVVLAFSYSGETDELIAILPLIKRLGISLIALTGNVNSTLAHFSTIHLDVSVKQEACPLGLAPTTSTTVSLVMGDALAISLLESRGFTRDDFALSHPHGSLGKRLLLHVHDIMHVKHKMPFVFENANIRAALAEMTEKKLGMTAIINQTYHVIGVFTDGDVRRMLGHAVDLDKTLITDVMTSNCVTIKSDKLAVEALQLLESKKMSGLLVVDKENKLVGALNMHDLIKAGIV